jgi:hypothetical protein
LQRRDLFWRGTRRNDRCPDHGRGVTVNISPEVRGNGTVRLIGVDTPERGEPLYEGAAAFAEDNLEG